VHDIVLRGGTIYDGTGGASYRGDVAIDGQFLAAVDKSIGERGRVEIDANGLAIAPGFINMLSWANESLIADGRAMSDIKQGVTLEVMGEGTSMGPLNDELKQDRIQKQGDIKYDITWSKLSEYLEFLVKRGVSTNVASFVGATTVRRYVIGSENRRPNGDELKKMQELVRQAMQEGALGVASALIYAPAFYAKTDELIALAKVAAEFDGMYTSHLRNEGNALLEGLDEFLEIAAQAKIRAEVYHLKAAGKPNWHKMDQVIAKLENARTSGQAISANMYTYTAAHTGLDAAMPPWVQEGGERAWIERLKQPEIRKRLQHEMTTPSDAWENGIMHAGADGVVLVGFKNPALKPLAGKTLAAVAAMRSKTPEETAMDLVIEDGSQVGTVYFWMSEDNVSKQLKLPWVSFGSDASAPAAEGVFLKSSNHPRAYGNVARFLGRYVREKKVTTFEDAIRRLTLLPATNLKLDRRGSLNIGNFADVVVFDPNRIIDNATFDKPHQYSSGVVHVFVNGKQVLKDGEHTGAFPGQVVHGPGKRGAVPGARGRALT
jgi:N-acyl-D-amino-acid deacylase